MKKRTVLLLLMLFSLLAKGQEPAWLSTDKRGSRFPESTYFTGFASVETSQAYPLQRAMQQAKADAQADLSKKVRSKIVSATKNAMSAQTINGQYDERESFFNESSVTSNTEIAGLKMETHYDSGAGIAYAFAYISKQELLNFYEANLARLIQQAETFLNTAFLLEQEREKVKARQQCEQIPAVLEKVYYLQELVVAIAGNNESLQQNRVEAIHSQSIQLLAGLEQGIFLCLKSNEDFFGQHRTTIGNKVKAQLATQGCSFVDEMQQADYMLQIKASTRQSSETDGVVFCYADVIIELYDVYKQKVIFSDELSQKGASTTREKAAGKACENVVPQIVERIKTSIIK